MNPWWLSVVVGVQLLLGFPALVFALEAVLGARARRSGPTHPVTAGGADQRRLAVVVPAHNERLGIIATLETIKPQLQLPRDRLIVVADNCTDETAELARHFGAEVLERHNLAQRGKGYALDHAVKHLAADAPDLVLFVDADCVLHPGAIGHLRAASLRTEGPVQACYIMEAPAQASAGLRVAALAWLIKNQVRPAGAASMGWPCQLTGSGMMFRWSCVSQHSLASGHITEDMQLGVQLGAHGLAPMYCEQALVSSTFPVDPEAQRTQRTRWEHGHLSMIAQGVPGLLRAAWRRRSFALLGMALDLSVPPLTTLVFLLLLILVVSSPLVWWSGHLAAVILPIFLLTFVSSAIFLAWWRCGRSIIGVRQMLALPLYLMAKVPIYASYIARRQTSWVRTGRDDGRDR